MQERIAYNLRLNFDLAFSVANCQVIRASNNDSSHISSSSEGILVVSFCSSFTLYFVAQVQVRRIARELFSWTEKELLLLLNYPRGGPLTRSRLDKKRGQFVLPPVHFYSKHFNFYFIFLFVYCWLLRQQGIQLQENAHSHQLIQPREIFPFPFMCLCLETTRPFFLSTYTNQGSIT